VGRKEEKTWPECSDSKKARYASVPVHTGEMQNGWENINRLVGGGAQGAGSWYAEWKKAGIRIPAEWHYHTGGQKSVC
jgi:hypothetical protein